MVVQIDNPANKDMHYGDKPKVLLIETPQTIPQSKQYSHINMMNNYNKLQQDIFEDQNKVKPRKTDKIPTLLKIALCTILTVGAIIFKKDLSKIIAKFFRHPFGTTP